MLLHKLLPRSLTAIIPLLCFCASAQAADIKVLASVALTAALDDLAPVYEDGEAADLIILTRPMMEDLEHQGKVAAGSLVDLVVSDS